ncbi:hypothetical protein DFP72DRAFT_557079 [Ephemerocybe angulata]|uniref:CBM1 domain-containing protein n=1 Tax=Ephemerocybe angulata TaxID=980116 RepID=A0A8H6HMY3_9AGAR|nr:hypothetical protein DFP72DRAFT_557079 [Tulosesus angulatus]
MMKTYHYFVVAILTLGQRLSVFALPQLQPGGGGGLICGGVGYAGPTTCGQPGYVCTKINDYYWTCLPGATTSSTTASSSTTTSSATTSTVSPQ